ncbi:electron transport complex, RnfABCDGE type, C subunit, partial [Vibrio cholerae HC-55B2]
RLLALKRVKQSSRKPKVQLSQHKPRQAVTTLTRKKLRSLRPLLALKRVKQSSRKLKAQLSQLKLRQAVTTLTRKKLRSLPRLLAPKHGKPPNNHHLI